MPIVIILFGGWSWLPRWETGTFLGTRIRSIEWLFVEVQFGQPRIKSD